MATFFEQQHVARQKTNRLIFLFILAVAGLILAVYLLVCGLLIFISDAAHLTWEQFVQPDLFLIITVLISLLIVAVSGFKILSLRSGGRVIAESLGGRRIDPSNRRDKYGQLLDVVEEMAIASGTAVPPVYVLQNEPGINAFAAGYSPDSAVIGVTQGAIDRLNRDELQGVIAHEFSHILNGDMRLNIKLIGYLAGIFSITVIGRILIHRPATSRNRAAPAVIAAGLGMIVLGMIGVLIGRMIKAAVSREREYLADASSVQFTRNPAGIHAALSKIAGHASGSRITAPEAEEASHMFFAGAVSGFFTTVFATHPPLPSRLEAIEANLTKGVIQEHARHADSAQRQKPPAEQVVEAQPDRQTLTWRQTRRLMHTAASAGTVLDSVGTIDDAQIDYARSILDNIPAFVREAAHEAYSARDVVYGLLLDRADVEIQRRQLAFLKANADPGGVGLSDRLVRALTEMPYHCRLPLLEMTLPALGEMSMSQYRAFKAKVNALIEMDRRFDISEWTLLRVLKHTLYAGYENRDDRKENRTLDQPGTQKAAATVFSKLAGFTSDQADMIHAFEKGVKTAGMQQAEFDRGAGIGDFDRAFDILELLKPDEKERFLKAVAVIISSDGEINETEAEVFRAIGETLNSPVPPVLPGRKLF